jgi:hypothetical protein
LAWKWTLRRAYSGPPSRNSDISSRSPRTCCVLQPHIQKTLRAASMVEMARRRCERPSSEVDPPRHLRSMAQGSPSPTFQPRLLLSAASPRPTSFLKEDIGRLTEKGVFRPVAFSRWVSRAFSRAKTRWTVAHHRPPHHQQAMLETLYENRDDKEATVHRRANRPLRLLRLERRLLRPFASPEGPRGVHNEFRRTIVIALRSIYGMELVPLYVP